MILHLITDDKFADYAINQFSLIDPSSLFVIVKYSEDEKIQNIQHIDKIIQVTFQSEKYDDLIKGLENYCAIVVHGLFYPWQEKIILSLSANVKIAWVCWGGEIYGRKQLLPHFLSKKTKQIYWQKQFKRLLKSKTLLGNDYFADISTFQKINYCLSDMQEEFQYVKEFTHSNMQYFWYNYYSIGETLGDLQYEKIKGNNILIGNSCTLENNHLDAFKFLNELNIQNRKIIVPLSYGSDWLQKIVLKKGRKLFGKLFTPLLAFMDRDEYNQLIGTCSIMIMPHLRPQAQGNIITGLWLGAKIYLSKNSLTYAYFKRIGTIVFSIEDDLKPGNKEALTALSDDMIEYNRTIMLREYGKDNMMPRIQEIVNELNRTE